MSGLVDRLLGMPGWVVLLVVGAVVFAEDALFVGFVLPGETIAVLGGAAARLGHVPLPAVMAVAIGAAIAGDAVGYTIGRALGPRLLQLRVLRTRQAGLDRARDLLARRGGSAVFLGRWVAFLRATVPALSGIAHMRPRIFFTFNALGGVAWGAVVVLLGYLAGASYRQIESTFGTGSAAVVLGIALVAVVVWRVRRHLSTRRDREAAGR